MKSQAKNTLKKYKITWIIYRIIRRLKDFRYIILRLKYRKKMTALKNIHLNERCFVIGNGPSLNINDLEKIKNEYTFACNRIYKLYYKTNWRPTYYCIQDEKVIYDIKEDIDYILINSKKLFLRLSSCNQYSNETLNNPNTYLFHVDAYMGDFIKNKFSSKIDKRIFEGNSVLYSAIQIAYYMGFTKIYLLGVDNNYSITKQKDGQIIKNDIKNYPEELDIDMTKMNIPNVDRNEESFLFAYQYLKAKGIDLLNATRGGKLEVVPRINLDEVVTFKETL